MKSDRPRARHLLAALDLPRQAATILARPEYHTAAFCLRYLERCEDLRCEDPRAGLAAARVAPALAQKVSREDCRGERAWCSLQVHAHAVAANAYRSVSDYETAELRTFIEAIGRRVDSEASEATTGT